MLDAVGEQTATVATGIASSLNDGAIGKTNVARVRLFELLS